MQVHILDLAYWDISPISRSPTISLGDEGSQTTYRLTVSGRTSPPSEEVLPRANFAPSLTFKVATPEPLEARMQHRVFKSFSPILSNLISLRGARARREGGAPTVEEARGGCFGA